MNIVAVAEKAGKKIDFKLEHLQMVKEVFPQNFKILSVFNYENEDIIVVQEKKDIY